MKSGDKQAAAELLTALVEVAIAHGRRHYSGSGEPLATTLAVLECLRREGFVTVEASPSRFGAGASGRDPLNLAWLTLERIPSSRFKA